MSAAEPQVLVRCCGRSVAVTSDAIRTRCYTNRLATGVTELDFGGGWGLITYRLLYKILLINKGAEINRTAGELHFVPRCVGCMD